MKKIAVTQRIIENESYFELRDTLDTNWASFFECSDFIPVLLPSEYDFESYFKEFKIDGILLTGGNDLSSINKSLASEKRDAFEKKLISYAIKNNIPLLGVCRGLQIIAEFFGSDFIKVENQVKINHSLKVNKNSKYYSDLILLDKVNSYHNYAVNNISDELMISATNENKIIKAIEHKKYKIFGQMWHPERELPYRENEINLINKILGEK